MKIVSWNVNGIRACAGKGAFLAYLEQEQPDILFLQEIKALVEDVPESVVQPMGYHTVWFPAQKKGYSGVALLTKVKPKMVSEGFGIERYDNEGRVLMADYGDFVALGVYFPNGQMSEERLQYKLDFYEDFFKFCQDMRKEGRHLVIVGDYNTAHKEIDLARPKENEGNSGFLPVERAWMDRLIDEMGYVDTFRAFNSEPDQYSWWTYRMAARQRNIGWRIDYCLVNKEFMPKVTSAFIRQMVLGSDHCPVGIEVSL